MSIFKTLDIAGSGMHVQTIRLNTVASNVANVDAIASNANETYKAKVPIFQSLLNEATGMATEGVKIKEIAENKAPAKMEYNPNHPLANGDGYIFRPNVNMVEEMANMMDASRTLSTNMEIMDTTKKVAIRLIQMGR